MCRLKMFTQKSSVHCACRYFEAWGHQTSLGTLCYSDTFPREKTAELFQQWGMKMRIHIGEVSLCPVFHLPSRIPPTSVRKWNACHCHLRQVTRPDPADKDTRRRLKIGYLSSDLKRHPCAYFLEPFLRCAVHKTVTTYWNVLG
jgi:predicted O-linked N-acetylglucosamine transferase (SPINDLY family)